MHEAWKHIRAILLLPGVVTVVIPATILYFTGTDTFDLWGRAPVARILFGMAGVLFIGLGLVLFMATNRLFARIGRGTLAPWNPPSRLVVEGIYRHVRNPMISGVFAVLLGESLIVASVPLLIWMAVFVTVVMIAIPLFEEPQLVTRFGTDYEEYRKNVPRWSPQIKPWTKNTNE